jgi:hypothetical protein
LQRINHSMRKTYKLEEKLSLFKPKTFHPSMMPDEDIALFIGRRKTGKTTALLDLLYENRRVPDCAVYCGTAEANGAYEKIVPETFIYNGWEPDSVSRMIARQKKINKYRRENNLPKKYTICVSDDNGWDKTFYRDPLVKQLLMNGRHDAVKFYCTLQDPLGFLPALRIQFDWVFLFRETNPDNLQRMWKYFARQIGTYETFCDIFNDITSVKGGCLVCRQSGVSGDKKDVFFRWVPKLRNWNENPKQKPWHVGSKSYWRFHFENYSRPEEVSD